MQARVMAREGRGASIVLCAPTGSGKTACAADAASRASAAGERFVFVTDRNVLAWQTAARFSEYGLDPPALLQGENTRGGPETAAVVVASAQTIQSRRSRKPLGPIESIDHLWIDEVHVCRRSTLSVAREVERAGGQVVGLSATPLAGHLHSWDGLVNMETTRGLQEAGWLVPETVDEVYTPDMTGARVVGGEWSDESAADAVGERVVDIVAEAWAERTAPGAKTLVFAATVAHARLLQGAFRRARPGLSSAVVSYMDGELDTAAAIEAFEYGLLTALFSVSKLAVGFDQPSAEVAVLARPLSRGVMLHIQQLGRVLRPAAGKTGATVIDASGNWARFLKETMMLWEHGMPELPPEYWPSKGVSAWTCRSEPADGEPPRPCRQCGPCREAKNPKAENCEEPCCGAKNPYTKPFCGRCGAAKPPADPVTKTCDGCLHDQTNPGAVVCEECGDPLPAAEASRCDKCGWLMRQLNPDEEESPLVCTGPTCGASKPSKRRREKEAAEETARIEKEQEERAVKAAKAELELKWRLADLEGVTEPLRTCIIDANRVMHLKGYDAARRRLLAVYRSLTDEWPKNPDSWLDESGSRGWADAEPDARWMRTIEDGRKRFTAREVGETVVVDERLPRPSLRPSSYRSYGRRGRHVR